MNMGVETKENMCGSGNYQSDSGVKVVFSKVKKAQDETERVKKWKFAVPSRRIFSETDMEEWTKSSAYNDIFKFIQQLNLSVCPVKLHSGEIEYWDTTQFNCNIIHNTGVRAILDLLDKLNELLEEIPPCDEARRFGNVAFRAWIKRIEEYISSTWLQQFIHDVLSHINYLTDIHILNQELTCYLTGGFGSAQRLDYGTGHELCFFAFLCASWKLGAFESDCSSDQPVIISPGNSPRYTERCLVLMVLHTYFVLMRKVIVRYTLEPAGSHGVWGLDDHFFLPYIFGSSQYCPPINEEANMISNEGSSERAPAPGDIIYPSVVDREMSKNLYFEAIKFTTTVKRGPFWEHSAMLYDISGVKAGWAKINRGMLKMYAAEVLGKAPVIQHFRFGSLLAWSRVNRETSSV